MTNRTLPYRKAGRGTVNAAAVAAAAPRLRKIGLDTPAGRNEVPAAQGLYQQLSAELGDAAHARYNAILARVASFAGATELAQ